MKQNTITIAEHEKIIAGLNKAWKISLAEVIERMKESNSIHIVKTIIHKELPKDFLHGEVLRESSGHTHE